MSSDYLNAIIEALRGNQWQQFEAQVRAFLKDGDEDRLWIALGATHGKEVDLVGQLLQWPQDSWRTACDLLLPAVGRAPTLSTLDAQRLLQFAARIEPSFRYAASQQLQPHIARTPALGVELGEQLRSGAIQGDGIARVWAGAFGSAAPQAASGYALQLACGDSSDTRLLSLLLQFISLDDLSVSSALTNEETKIATSLRQAATEIGLDAWVALTCIAEISATAMSALTQAIDLGDVQAVFAVSNWLHRVSSPTVGANRVPLEQLVSRLLQLALANEQFQASIDSSVASLLRRSALRPLVLPSVAELAIVNAKVVELFSSTFDEVCDEPDNFVQMLTVWLLRQEATFAAIGSLLSRCTAGRAPARLDVVTFNAAGTEQKVKAARRLLALTYSGPTLCCFIASIAESPTLPPEGLEIAAQMLNEAFVEYPGATVEFLRVRTRPSSREEPFAAVYRGVYVNALRWRRVLARLPKLGELRPTDTELHALRAMKQRMNRDIMRGASERSIFAGLFTSVHLAQGRRFASHTRFGPPQVVDMRHASHSIELPSSELADPMRGMLQRAAMLRGAR